LAIVISASLFFVKYIKYLMPNSKEITDSVYSGHVDHPFR